VGWLNYHHLLYFWLVAKEGGLAPASEQLKLAQSTVSGQIRSLEQSLGEKLFVRTGRRLALTEIGRVVYRYADEIFSTGRELQDVLRGQAAGRPQTLVVGIADVVPKRVARALLDPALHLESPVRLVCREDRPERLLAALAVHELDVVLTDAPVPANVRVKAFNHELGECGVTFLAAGALARAHRVNFPASLDGAPVLLPTDNTSLRRSLDHWFDARGLRPNVVGEFEDSALLMAFGQTGLGIFPVPAVIAREVRAREGVETVGEAAGVRERYYAVSVERRLKHPAVLAVSQAAKKTLF
jgi:LysR family transcriptional regulator, transcriptional activator of nhaA